MKKSADKDNLLSDVLGDSEEFRASSLAHTLQAARRAKKQRRLIRHTAIASVALLFVAVLLSQFSPKPVTPPPPQPIIATATPPSPIEQISDEELLAQFPGRAVALVGPPGRSRLIFLDASQ